MFCPHLFNKHSEIQQFLNICYVPHLYKKKKKTERIKLDNKLSFQLRNSQLGRADS